MDEYIVTAMECISELACELIIDVKKRKIKDEYEKKKELSLKNKLWQINKLTDTIINELAIKANRSLVDSTITIVKKLEKDVGRELNDQQKIIKYDKELFNCIQQSLDEGNKNKKTYTNKKRFIRREKKNLEKWRINTFAKKN